MWLWLALALAQEPLYEADYEIVVSTEVAVGDAKRAVDAAVEGLGYTMPIHSGKRTHHLSPRLWEGGVMIHEEGFARVHRPMFFPLPGFPAEDEKLSHRNRQLHPGPKPVPTAGVTFITQGKRLRQNKKTQVIQALEPHLRAYRDAIAAREQAWRLLELHEQLHLAWELGLTPDGRTLGEDPAQRRAWLVERWLNTADNPDGAQVRERIRDFDLDKVRP